MSEEKLRAAVIGGGLGGSHGYAYARAPEYELVAICDLMPEVFPRFYERAEIPPAASNSTPTTMRCSRKNGWT